MSTHEIGQFIASDGYAFRYRHWKPTARVPSGYVVALHGIQSHAGWYESSSNRLAEHGYDVRFLDRRGSGLNDEQRGHAAHEDRLINDVVQFLLDVSAERGRCAPDAPITLLAVSWSGKLAVAACARRPELVDALALLYPGICAKIRAGWCERKLLQLADFLGVKHRPVRLPLDDATLFTDVPKWQDYIRDDRMALHQATTGFLNASRKLDVLAARAPERIACPVLLMLAGKDRIIDNRATRAYFERFASNERTLIEYPDAAHTLEFEPDRDTFIADLVEWLRAVDKGQVECESA